MDRDIIKKRVDLEHDRFKFFFTIVMALTGGLAGLLLKGFNDVVLWLFICGLALNVIFLVMSIKAHRKVERLLKLSGGGVINGNRRSDNFGSNNYNWRFISSEGRKQAFALQQKSIVLLPG